MKPMQVKLSLTQFEWTRQTIKTSLKFNLASHMSKKVFKTTYKQRWNRVETIPDKKLVQK